MYFLVCLCRDGWHGTLAKATRAANGALLQMKNLKITLDLLQKDKIDNFSSKQSFEEKSLSSIMMMKFLRWKPISNLPHVLADIISHFED